MIVIQLISAVSASVLLGVAIILLNGSYKKHSVYIGALGLVMTLVTFALTAANWLEFGPDLQTYLGGQPFSSIDFSLLMPAVFAILLIERIIQGRVVKRLNHEASHDPLTKLANRTKFSHALNKMHILASKSDRRFAVLLLDLDRFKEVNDTLGHTIGDELLSDLSLRLSQFLPNEALLARLGGDEFAILLPNITSPEEVEKFAAALCEEVCRPLEIKTVILEVGGSIGIAIFPDHGVTPDELLQRADIAMYAAKRRQVGFEFYCPDIDPHSLQILTLSRDLRTAIAADELELVFQPKVDLKSTEVVGAEALARWWRPNHGYVTPTEFIADAEQSDLIVPLTEWVLDAALERGSTWLQSGQYLDISVNISARLLHHAAFIPTVRAILDKWAYPPERLVLEVTENALLADPIDATEKLRQLSEMGVRISIDDFGTGYSSLAYLKDFAASEIKIDKGFILNLLDDETDLAIVKSVISLAHDIGLKVVAEGIETIEVLEALDKLQCDIGQGYFLGEPMGWVKFDEWLDLSIWKQSKPPIAPSFPRDNNVIRLPGTPVHAVA